MNYLYKRYERENYQGLLINYLILVFGVLMMILSSCSNNQEKESESEQPYLAVEEKVYDYGEIEYQSNGRCYFTFENSSNYPLIINRVGTSCGCTRPEWPKEPVKPGEKGLIGVTYNTRITGNFRKSITVYSNAENSPLKLFIKGTVMPAENNKMN